MTDLTYLSLGAGVQSTALLVMACQKHPDVPAPDLAIFADTGDEPGYVYKHLELLESWSTIPIVRVSIGRLSETILARLRGEMSARDGDRFAASIPAFTRGDDGRAAPIRRQCTTQYKIEPIQREVKRRLGYIKGQRVRKRAVALLGISLDEAARMKPSRVPWIENRYPLVDLGLRRGDCRNIIRDAGIPVPEKSSCVFCPYRSDASWIQLRRDAPDDWRAAVEFDASIRNMMRAGVTRPVFIHRTLKPLGEVEFRHERQADLFQNECEGVCGV